MEEPKDNKKAVALKYDPTQNGAPIVVAKGKGEIAEAILRLAEEHNIPVTDNPPIVEILGHLELGGEIPPELYKAVAEILAFFLLLQNEAN